MPTISMFYGIVIRMYYDDHKPLIHKEELIANWKLAKNKEMLYRINPLN